jgi:tetratricopeptide (TPR) repeat protein
MGGIPLPGPPIPQCFTRSLLALLAVASPLHAQTGAVGGTCVVSILDRGSAVRSKGNLTVGDCFGPGGEVASPPGTVVKLVTPLKDTIALSGRLRIKEQSPKGQSFWVRGGSAAFNVIAKQLSFFNVEGQNGNRTFQAAVRGTTFEMAVEEGRRVTLTPREGQVRVTRAVKLGIAGADRASGKRGVEAARAAGAEAPGSRAAQALKPDRSDLLEGSYAEQSTLVAAGSDAVAYALDRDDVVSFETVEACVAAFTTQAANDPGPEGYRNLGDCHLQGDNPQQAIANYSRALAMDRQLHPDGLHSDVADDYRSLADAQSFTDPRQAITLLRKAMAIDLQIHGTDPDPDIAEDHRTLADFHLLLDEPDQAVAELQTALAMDQRLYPDGQDVDLAEDYRSLGESHTLAAAASGDQAGHLRDAIAAFGQALAIDQRLSDEASGADLARDHRGLGYAYLVGNDPDRAFASFQQALSIGLRAQGITDDGDPAAVDVSGLDLDSNEVDADDVEDLYEDAMTLSELAQEMDHSDQADAYRQLADRIAAKLEED